MAHALTEHYEAVINRLIEMGLFANRSEVVRAGLRELEERYLGDTFSRAESISQGPPRQPRGPRPRAGRKGKAPPSSHV